MNIINRDILYVKGTIRGWDIKIIVVYYSVSDEEKNHYEEKKKIEKILENSLRKPTSPVRDFNCSIGFKGQKPDDNSKMIIEWMEQYKLTMQ